MAKNLILVNTNLDILKYDNRKAIELAQTLGRPLTSKEYETLKIKKSGSCDPAAIRGKSDKPKCPR
jgi:hypothetical protein